MSTTKIIKPGVSLSVDQINIQTRNNFKNILDIENCTKAIFYLTGINRGVILSHVTKMAASVGRLGILRPIVIAKISFIDGVRRSYLIDGQHLFNACSRLGINVPYIEISIANEQELIEVIAKLNTSSKTWCMRDYVLAWSYIKASYRTLSEFSRIYDFDLGIIAALLHWGGFSAINTSGPGSSISKIIKRGDFTVKNQSEAKLTLDRITDVCNIIPRTNAHSMKFFIIAYVCFMKNLGSKYNHEKFLSYMDNHQNEFRTITLDQEELNKLLFKAVK